MATKPRITEGKIEYRKFGDSVEFVLNNLTPAEVEALEEESFNADTASQMLTQAIRDGFVVSVKRDTYSNADQCTLICNAKGMLNTGLAVTGRSPLSPYDALFVALWKLYFLSKGDLTQHKESGRSTSRRG